MKRSLPFLAALLLAGCGKDPNSDEARAALGEVRGAALKMAYARVAADRKNSTHADGEDYRAAREALTKAEAAAIEAGALEEHVKAARMEAETRGKKDAEEIEAMFRN
jgi:hypothetical protein